MLGPFATASRRTPSNFTLSFTRCRYCRTPPAHRCPQQQRQRVTGVDRYGPIEWAQQSFIQHTRPSVPKLIGIT